MTILEAVLALAIVSGLSLYTVLLAVQADEAIQLHYSKECAEAQKLLHDFPMLKPSENFHEVCR